jgi:hypothetical protein
LLQATHSARSAAFCAQRTGYRAEATLPRFVTFAFGDA